MNTRKVMGCLNKTAKMPDEYTNTIDKNVTVEEAVTVAFPKQ